jgi:hypothetical protein
MAKSGDINAYLRELSPDHMFDHRQKNKPSMSYLWMLTHRFRLYFDTYLANGVAPRPISQPEDFPILLVKAKDESEDFRKVSAGII